VTEQVRHFQPDVVHITGPGDVGILGLWVAHSLRVPLVASWHTNLHEYAGRRLYKLLSFLPRRARSRVSLAAEKACLLACLRFYGIARFLLAPNQGMVDLLHQGTGKPAFLLAHGVDTSAFSPDRRNSASRPFRIGYVGRLTPEKNVRLFAALEKDLRARTQRDFRITLIGDGNERDWLRHNLQSAETPGILRGEALAQAYADMDVFVFPSETDTFGLVLLEAMASGVPVLASPATGARVGIRHGVSGFHAPGLAAFSDGILQLMDNDARRWRMGAAARAFACSRGWNEVFEDLYDTYERGLAATGSQLSDRQIAESPASLRQ
jgi:glycosyltransferase involved in cell wall biosynthesis